MKTEITRKDEEKFLKFKIAENAVFSNQLNFDEIMNLILQGTLPLQVSDDDGTKVLGEEQFNEIKRVVPFLLKIIDKPRSFIKSLEEKVPVETAKRINHKAIAKLSQDSNDWYARTLLAVKPKNIVADINEETIDLYENRFICSLTDRIAKLVATRRQYYQDALKTVDDNNAIWAMDHDYHTTGSFQLFNKITKNSSENITDVSMREKIEEELRAIEEVEKRIRLIKRSEFYRTLHKKRKVVDPIQKTNILMFEFNYNQGYKLWKYLNQFHEEDRLENDIEIEAVKLEDYYWSYSLLIVMSALYDMGFAETTKKKFSCNDGRLTVAGELKYTKGKHTIKLWENHEGIHLSYNYDDKRNKWDEFVFCPDYINFENLNRSQVNEKTEALLNKLSETEKFSPISSRYALVSINMNRCSEQNPLSDKVYRRFYGIGSNFSPEEKRANLDKWGDYKAGIAIITPVKLRDNFLRIEKIINYHLIKNVDLTSSPANCPLCGGTHIVSAGNQNYTCHDCHHNVSITYCTECDKTKKRPILWVKYADDKFLQREDVVRGDFANNKTFDQMSKIELIMGEKAVTSFELAKEKESWKLKTICPHCGIRLGDTKER